MKRLRISTDLQLPADEAVTRSFGILGMRGSGKSNAAVVMAEEMSHAQIPWVAIDPKGDWWGIRAGRDGKAGGGLPVVIFGGEHADVPLEPTAKAAVLVADLIVNEGITCVLDLSEFTKTGKIAFLAGPGREEGFADRLFRKKKREQGPMHVFLEEAHDYVPQKATGDVGKMVDSVSKLQTMARTKGIGCTVISQRSARVHKDILTQNDTLIVFRTLGPQDRQAIELWVRGHGMSQELLASLPELKTGESWLWSPEWLEVMQRIRWRQRETFDSGATPTTGTTRRTPATLADVDLEAVTAQMKETIERAKADDPKELRRQLAEANRRLRELEARPAATAEPERIEVQVPVEIPVFPEETLRRVEALVEKATGPMFDLLSEAQELAGVAKHGRDRLYQLLDEAKTSGPARATGALATSPSSAPTRAGAAGPSRKLLPTPAAPAPSLDGDVGLKRGAKRMLEVLARYQSVKPSLTTSELSTLALVTKGGTFSSYMSTLRSAGLIVEDGRDVSLSSTGAAIAPPGELPYTPEELALQHGSFVKAGARRMLEDLMSIYPDWMTTSELSDRTGVTKGGTFSSYMSLLRARGLIEERGRDVRANPVLYLGT